MATHYRRITDYLQYALRALQSGSDTSVPAAAPPVLPKVPGGSAVSVEAIEERWGLPGLPAAARPVLADPVTMADRERYARSIENFIGAARVPIGLAGPLRVSGVHARG